MFHDIVEIGPGGRFMTADNAFGRPGTETAIRDLRLNHFNLASQLDDVRALVAWHNRVQELALATGPGSLEFLVQERDRIVAIYRQVPTIIVLFLGRPAIVPHIAAAAAALLVEFGARDDAVVDALLGVAQARGGCRSTFRRPREP